MRKFFIKKFSVVMAPVFFVMLFSSYMYLDVASAYTTGYGASGGNNTLTQPYSMYQQGYYPDPSFYDPTIPPWPTAQNNPMSPAGTLSTDTLSCSISAILANAVTTIIENLVAQIFGAAFGASEVPVVEGNLRFKEVGYSINLFGISIPILPSWDSFAYCLANTLIIYAAHATIYWIRTGFEGNPAYVDDPIGFMERVADFEFSNFAEGVAGALACYPFRVDVVNRLALAHNGNYYDYGRCLMDDQYGGRFEEFMAGNYFDFDIWFDYTQNMANNPQGSYMLAQNELNRRISTRQNSLMIELDWGRGYLSWKDKENPNRTITPGQVIQKELENRLGLDENRLVLADEFDEVLNELVNYLIRWALNETFSAMSGD